MALDPTTGAVDAWLIRDGVRVATTRVGMVDPFAATLVGIGDFNGDGTDDVLWTLPQNNLVGVWLVNNGTSIGWITLGYADLTMHVPVGVGNFNADAYDDVMWLNLSTGTALTWIKLATELSKRDTGRTLYILDEPTTGLHFEDVNILLHVLNKLVDRGNTVLVIEHNLEVIKVADYIIDLGPEGGERGGYIIAEGTPEQLIQNTVSYTAQYLKVILDNAGISPHTLEN